MLAQLLRSNILPARMLLTAGQSLWLRRKGRDEGGLWGGMRHLWVFTGTFIKGPVQGVQDTRPANSFRGAPLTVLLQIIECDPAYCRIF